MAGVCAKPRKNGKFQGWYIDELGRQKNFIGTRNRASTRDLAKRLEDQARPARLGLTGTKALTSASLPLTDVIQEYLGWGNISGGRGRRPWSPTHARMRKTHLEFWEKHIGKKISDIASILPIVERELTVLQKQGLKRKTLANYSEAISSFCDFLLKRDYILVDPLKRLAKIDTSPEKTRRVLGPEEIRQLLKVAPTQRRLLYEVAFASGLRVNELTQLEARDLDIERGGIVLRPELTKNRKAGFQPLHPSTVSRLRTSLSVGEPKAFYERAGRCVQITRPIPKNPLLYVPSHPARDLEKDLKKIGINKEAPDGSIIDFHSARAAYITLVGLHTPVVKEMQALARHQSANLTIGVYAKTTEKRLTDVATAVAENFLSTDESKKANAPAMKIWSGRRDLNPRPYQSLTRLCTVENAHPSEKVINITRQLRSLPITSEIVSDNQKRTQTQKTSKKNPQSITVRIHLKDGAQLTGIASEREFAGKKFVEIDGQMICPSQITRIIPQ